MYRSILAPTDLSPASFQALKFAFALAEPLSAVVHVLHAWDLPSYLRPDLTVWSAQAAAMLADHTRTQAEAALRKFLGECGGLDRPNTHWKVVCDAPYAAILREAEDFHHDLIVMGTHGRTGLGHIVLGSVTERVLRHAPCPVIAHRGASYSASP